jgi:trans-L-3-hydroxyproline dehydratase
LDLTSPLAWAPPEDWIRVQVIDSHAAGEPFRVILGGTGTVQGESMIERRRFARENLDELRRALMWEPRGHADMYGGLVGPPTDPASDLSVLFLHNEGFSTMCGHGIIALTKVVLDTGILPRVEPETRIKVDTPAGQIEAVATVTNGMVSSVRFRNVPSFVVDLENTVEVPGLGDVKYDLAFGGAFYAYVDALVLGLSVHPQNTSQLIAVGRAIKEAVAGSRSIPHPTQPELGFLYGVIFIGRAGDPSNHSRNVCVFADGEVDRSPTGTGVSGRLAIHHARGEIVPGETITIESIVGSTFQGRIAGTTDFEGVQAVIPEVTGTAHITGRSELWLDPADTLGAGFLLR